MWSLSVEWWFLASSNLEMNDIHNYTNEPRIRGFLSRSDTNWAEQPIKLARGLKFRMKEVGGSCYQCSKNKGADAAQLNCSFLFEYANIRFSLDASQ